VADTVCLNGQFAALDADLRVATAVAVEDGRFAAVGDDASARAFAGPSVPGGYPRRYAKWSM
jgi:predicted amidohydrolase YtcJ